MHERHMTPAQQRSAVIQVVVAVATAIRDLGSIPSGHLYATLSDHLSLAQYNAIIDCLKKGGCITEENHLLRWASTDEVILAFKGQPQGPQGPVS